RPSSTLFPSPRLFRSPVRVLKETKSSLSVGPRELSFPRSAGFPARLVRVWNAADLPVDVVRVFADHPAVVCTWAAGPGNQATVRSEEHTSELQSPYDI